MASTSARVNPRALARGIRSRARWGRWSISFIAAAVGACWRPAEPVSHGAFRFAVFGDGPYFAWEAGRFRRVTGALNERPLAFVLHVGDFLWYPCLDAMYHDRLADMNRIAHPVVYTPGDNEWADCHEARSGEYDPLERLGALRRIFFAHPGRSLGARPMGVETQAADSTHGEFAENVRWTYRGVVFATLHVVGGGNGSTRFAGRTSVHDAEVRRRTDAAVTWLREAFAAAREQRGLAVVLAMHADPRFDGPPDERRPFTPLLVALAEEAEEFARPVLVIHGDYHEYTVDRPLTDPATGGTVVNVRRLQTFGSPDIGWVDVVVDTSLATLFRFEPNLTPGWMWW